MSGRQRTQGRLPRYQGRVGRTFRLLVLVSAFAPTASRATWSIVAVDPETREVGGAVASCTGGADLVFGIAPGRGIAAAQARSNFDGRDELVRRLAAGEDAHAALAAVASSDFDPENLLSLGFAHRQYGVVSLAPAPRVENFTGTAVLTWASAERSETASAQGNILRGPAVVRDALAAYQASSGCALAERLLRALEAGAAAGGDRRCAAELTALSAALVVAKPGDASNAPSLALGASHPRALWMSVRGLFESAWPLAGASDENPVRALRARFDTLDRGAATCSGPVERGAR